MATILQQDKTEPAFSPDDFAAGYIAWFPLAFEKVQQLVKEAETMLWFRPEAEWDIARVQAVIDAMGFEAAVEVFSLGRIMRLVVLAGEIAQDDELDEGLPHVAAAFEQAMIQLIGAERVNEAINPPVSIEIDGEAGTIIIDPEAEYPGPQNEPGNEPGEEPG